MGHSDRGSYSPEGQTLLSSDSLHEVTLESSDAEPAPATSSPQERDSSPIGATFSPRTGEQDENSSEDNGRISIEGNRGAESRLLLRAGEEEGSASVIGSIFNLTNTIIGGGVLSLPFAFMSSGILLGLILLLVTAILAALSLMLLVRSIQWTGKFSYKEIARQAMGRAGSVTVDLSMVLLCFGTCVAYMVLIGDLIPPVLHLLVSEEQKQKVEACEADWPWWSHKIFVMGMGLFVVTPLTMLTKINSLRFTSIFAVLSVLYLTSVVVFRSIAKLVNEGIGIVHFVNFGMGLINTFTIISFAFSTHFNLFSIYQELRKPTKGRVLMTVNGSVISCLTIYTLMGTAGYFTFYEAVKGNVLINYSESDIPVEIGRIGLAFTICFSYPLLSFPCKRTIETTLFYSNPFTHLRNTIESILITSTSFGLAILIPDVSAVFGITGGLFASQLCYILPGLIILRLDRDTRWFSPRKIMCYFLITVGVAATIGSIAVFIWDQVTAKEEEGNSACG
eukprot:gb/GECH01012197.1/.p1 GENE.gb/GECH01012197.1/~~gb/GECH01012197.1/.p1  ORF type:complete len:507 (+),score=81.11 gb/GECH01012197.1/:1-1521(+)